MIAAGEQDRFGVCQVFIGGEKQMRKLITAFAIGFSLLLTAPAAVADPDGIFPLDFPLPFPWGTIEGLWVAEDTAIHAAFKFEVLYKDQCEDRRVLKVTQIDTLTGETVAKGNGFTRSSATFVTAGMTAYGNSPYMIYVGAFEDRSGARAIRYHALKFRSFNDPLDPGVIIRIRKVNERTPYKRSVN